MKSLLLTTTYFGIDCSHSFYFGQEDVQAFTKAFHCTISTHSTKCKLIARTQDSIERLITRGYSMLFSCSKLLILVAVNTLALPPRNIELDSVEVIRGLDKPRSLYTCPLTFESNTCAVDSNFILNDHQCRDLCTCNEENKVSCTSYGRCYSDEVLDICKASGGCGCYARLRPSPTVAAVLAAFATLDYFKAVRVEGITTGLLMRGSDG